MVLMHCVYWPSYPKHINTPSAGIQLRKHGLWSKSSVSAVKERRYYTRIKAEVELTRNWRFPGRSFHAGHFSRLKAARFLKPARPPIIIIETGQFAEYTHARTPLCVYTQVQYTRTHIVAPILRSREQRESISLCNLWRATASSFTHTDWTLHAFTHTQISYCSQHLHRFCTVWSIYTVWGFSFGRHKICCGKIGLPMQCNQSVSM